MKIAGRNLSHHGTSAAFVKNKLLWKVEEMMKTKQTDELLAKDEQYVWHGMRPFSPNSTMVGAKAEGCWIEDIQGKRYLDGMSGLWCVNSGYGRKELAEAAYKQLQTLSYFPMSQSHEPAIKLAEKLNEWLEGSMLFSSLIVVRKRTKQLLKLQDNTIRKKVNHIVINLCHVTAGIMGIQWQRWQRRDKHSVDINMSHLLQDFYM